MLRDRLAHNDIGACHCEAIQMMASDPNAPQELKELGKVLQRVMAGSKNMGLSNLPAEWAALIQRMKAEG